MRMFRTMKESPDGLPSIGPGGRLLGVRPGSAPRPDVTAINLSDIVLPGHGGMSVVPNDPMFLSKHRRPFSLGGSGQDPVWYIDEPDLGADLRFRQDMPTHGVVEPSRAMSLQGFQDALAATRARWKLFCR